MSCWSPRSACLLAAGGAASDPVFAGQCGITAQQTVWGEYGWPTLLPILAKPGTLLAATTHSGTDYSVKARGARRRDLRLRPEAGDAGGHAGRAGRSRPRSRPPPRRSTRRPSRARGGCATPLVVENELFGAVTPTPWTASTAQYRANVLAFLTDLAAHGRAPGAPRQQVAVPRLDRRRRLVAIGGEGLRHRPRGLSPGDQGLAARADPRQPAPAGELPERGHDVHVDRDPGRTGSGS